MATAQAAVAVDVASVRFSQVRLTGQAYPWWSAEVTLRSSTSSLPSDVQLRLWVRFKEPEQSYVYTGAVKLYALERTAKVRFYLPPEAVRVRRLNQAPEAYYVEVSSNKGTEPATPTHSQPVGMNNAELNALKNAPALPLVPHYQTPLYALPETWRDLPAYVIP